ncbi:NUDIX hydrolase [Nocardia sp. NBC_00508]|uniref:NUDIX hydrolase n=1 Tax=Nocardia sp. NBC_00508 TaxID=2975992 RepID=UPI002E81D508|nr:NUDIX hydrolase [Nocardia sp. NBC_00508]WUD68428.1 NUDIX hydrolase [Nocardia sp. NBC_00508]
MTDEDNQFARARLAAGALFVRGDSVLLVHKTYGNGWDIPGGYLEPGEAPAAACHREVHEELGIDRAPKRLLVHDWAPTPADRDKVLYVFDCGDLGDEQAIQLQASELDRWKWVPVAELDDYAIPRLARRLRQAHAAHTQGHTAYLEHGEPAP